MCTYYNVDCWLEPEEKKEERGRICSGGNKCTDLKHTGTDTIVCFGSPLYGWCAVHYSGCLFVLLAQVFLFMIVFFLAKIIITCRNTAIRKFWWGQFWVVIKVGGTCLHCMATIPAEWNGLASTKTKHENIILNGLVLRCHHKFSIEYTVPFKVLILSEKRKNKWIRERLFMEGQFVRLKGFNLQHFPSSTSNLRSILF